MMVNDRKVLLMTLLVSMTIILASCGNKLGSMNIFLDGEVIEDGDKIIVKGKSNLIPESRLTGRVVVNEHEVLSETTELVDKKGNFTMELDHHQFGDAEVVVSFDFVNGLQDEEIREHYGEGGENIEGSFVYVDEHWDVEQINKKAEVSVALQADDDKDKYEFSEPAWAERPEDYGEPRVWIEIDEVTDDGEHFYVSGSTNLLEGSSISGFYSDRWGSEDHTRINPDGTFDLKIEYHYSEDPSFTVIFDPYSRQWESVRDHYGYAGEKLVGNLVEQNGNSLRIVATFDYEHD